MKPNLSKTRLSQSLIGMICVTVVIAGLSFLHAQEPKDKSSNSSSAASQVDPIVAQLVDGHNKERAKEGLPPLRLEAKLQEAAKIHAKDMADHDMMSHDGSDGSTPAQRAIRVGYHYLSTGENVAVGYRDVPSVMQCWMDSPPHKKNILADYTEIGVAMVLGEDGRPFWAAEFGTPMPSFDPATAAANLAKRLNEERAAAKLPALEVDPSLSKAAKEQAGNLAKKKSEGGGSATFDGIDQKLYQDLAVSTSGGHPTPEAMTKVIMASDDLKKQVLGKYARIGTGYATSKEGTPYWCLILANPAREPAKKKTRINSR